MNNNGDRPVKEFLPQLTLECSVKENAAGGETLSFVVPLGPVSLICIANIPGEGETTAPVYVKFKVDTRPMQQAMGGPRPTKRVRRAPVGDDDDVSWEEEDQQQG
jgi:hypothetical protein